jgi:O-antigen ligase
MGILLSVIAFASSFLLGRQSLCRGLCAVFAAGYLYGILRANYLQTATYFLFDCAVLGLYLSRLGELPAEARRPGALAMRTWVSVLIGWALVMSLIPIQHPLIQLVGLRGNAFLLPFLLFGTWLKRSEYLQLACWLALLNLMTLAFAGAEYVLGVPYFYPLNQATDLIYRSNDVAGYTALRIPATFASAHNYAGTMIASLPWLLGALVQREHTAASRLLIVLGTIAALLGVFLTATRIGIGILAIVILVATFSGELKGAYRLGWLALLGLVYFVVASEERLQRFLTLANTDDVVTRVSGSVNLTFIDILFRYPMGNGMGAGGTSLPYFLQELVKDHFMIENEYARILLEQGVIGLVLWFAFLGWVYFRPAPRPGSSWLLGWRLLWYTCAGNCAVAALGTGLMTAIPSTPMLLLSMGVVVAYRGDPARRPRVTARTEPRTGETQHEHVVLAHGASQPA